jgi:cytoskeletal protein RodZ
MSSQFSYELDERQIRLMMQDAELDYNEAMWHKFDEMSVTQARTSSNIGNYIPTINFGISRSIIVPVIFIVLIGGLSAMLFSFVDFKKKEAMDKEIPYVAKIEPTKQPKVSSKPIITTKSVTTPSITAAKPVLDTNAIPVITNTANVLVEPVIKKVEAVKIAETKAKEPSVNPSSEPKKETVIIPQKKKKKIKTEVLPTINATAPNLNEGVSEPELDLK